MDLQGQIGELLRRVGRSELRPSAYDTAWLARLGELDEPLAARALAWLRANQIEDGSWGTLEPRYPQERLVCTLAAMVALGEHGAAGDRERLERGRAALDTMFQAPRLESEDTVGFEMLVPMLMDETSALGVYARPRDDLVRWLSTRRASKLSMLPRGVIHRGVTMAFSAEMVGRTGAGLIDLDNIQEEDGSVAASPAATAFFALSLRRGDPRALGYLRRFAREGAAPGATDLDVFERGWVLWNLMLLGPPGPAMLAQCAPHLDALERGWVAGRGISSFGARSLFDADTSSIVYDVLAGFGRRVDVEAILGYEQERHFRTYPMEAAPSISTNVHVLGALVRAGADAHRSPIEKILAFLRQTCREDSYWHDKWHASPYYTTAHAIIAGAQLDEALFAPAVGWLLRTQREDGSWGHHRASTPEETAYALQALASWRRGGRTVPPGAIERGGAWLREHSGGPHPALWLMKSLYCPVLIVRASVLGALALVQEPGIHW